MMKTMRVLVTVLLVLIAGGAGSWVWNDYMYSPWTRDGRVRADIITVAPDVSGWVTKLDVRHDAVVKKGQLLFQVDAQRYHAALAKSEATAENEKYALALAQHKYERRKQLVKSQSISAEDLEVARINTQIAEANYKLALAELETAKLNVNRTKIYAPESGNIINLNLRQGNYVSQGVPVLAIVKADSFYVTGYFEETKLPLIHLGQHATVTLLGGGELTGEVASIGRAIANTNTQSDNQLLPQIQQTFNWVRLAQRIPVDIKLASVPQDIRLSAGMTVSIHLSEQ
ncbi:efflux RND transporter periplasmic adaptor subunit [Marinomonas pollencensis]|uniref:RND family efflux transporter MFP subunit n=1 Tax=Marinomonas pollencensis TaxID=491954 RepID=A0A3E0DXP6_9GAMM|nr:HlyD family secretion protein [Marinomonas pollencensis]REG86871.1 RND family efflux transporter MFP subunit [Marinomonas pollencensis]